MISAATRFLRGEKAYAPGKVYGFLARPREQLGSFKEVPSLETFRLKGVWLHAADYEDARTTDRLRWQLWTVRIEPTSHLVQKEGTR